MKYQNTNKRQLLINIYKKLLYQSIQGVRCNYICNMDLYMSSQCSGFSLFPRTLQRKKIATSAHNIAEDGIIGSTGCNQIYCWYHCYTTTPCCALFVELLIILECSVANLSSWCCSEYTAYFKSQGAAVISIHFLSENISNLYFISQYKP